MGRKQNTVFIDGYRYELSQIGGVEGRELVVQFAQLFSRVFSVLAPFLGDVATKAKAAAGAKPAGSDPAAPAADDVANVELSVEALTAIGEALQTISPKQLEPLWDAFSKHAWVIGKDGKTRMLVAEVFDDHFAGEYFAMVQFFVEAAKLNFANFLQRALGSASALPSTAPTP